MAKTIAPTVAKINIKVSLLLISTPADP